MQRVFAPRWAALWYALAAVVMTWPLVLGFGRDVPWDFGDSLLNCWIIGWNDEHLLRFLGGDLKALGGLWHGNIFYPDPYALAYSELLIAQSLQALPVYALTGNLILCYNLLFLSTFALSALGMYLLVRELTGDVRAAFIAGLIYGFLPYRMDQATHLQVLSSQWMPFALFGLRRYFATRRLRPLAGAVAAIVAQNLSCGYYLVYFAMFVPVYVLYEIVTRHRLRDVRTWAALAAAGIVVAACTVPFMLPYLELRALTGERRSLAETAGYAADLFAYATADANLRVWGTIMRAYPRPEGHLFPGLVLAILAGVGGATVLTSAWRHEAVAAGKRAGFRWAAMSERRRRVLLTVAVVVGAVSALVALWAFLGLRARFEIGPIEIKAKDVGRPIVMTVAALLAVLVLSPRTRSAAWHVARSYQACFLLCAVVAAYLSLGPEPKWGGWPFRDGGFYRWLFELVPGMNGLRVPARLGMLVMLFLTVIAGSGMAVLLTRTRRAGVVMAAVAAAVLLESAAVPIPLNQMTSYAQFGQPPDRITPGTDPPPVYAHIARLPAGSAIVEFPLGETGWDIRAVYHATMHWKPIVNGYSGGFPARYIRLARLLEDVSVTPDEAWSALRATGPTHAVVHLAAYRHASVPSPEPWLVGHGARLVAEFADARLYELPARD
jgi:hypothetical protein